MVYEEFIDILGQLLNQQKAKTSTYSKQLIELIREKLEKEDIVIRNLGTFINRRKKKPGFQAEEKLLNEMNSE